MLYFQILQLKNGDTQSFLLPFTFPILWWVCLRHANFDSCIKVLQCDSSIYWGFISARLAKFQGKKILSGCFNFDDLNLGLAEAIEILKATAQKFGKSGLLLFETLKIVYTILQCSLVTVPGLRSYYHTRIVLGHSATSPFTFLSTRRCHFSC